MIEVIVWMLLTLGIGSLSAIIAKRYGVEYIIGMFASFTVIANIIASKIVVFGPFNVPAAVLVYSTTFLLTDFLSELYSEKEAFKAVAIGFISNIILVISIWVAVEWQSAPFWTGQSAFESIFGLVPRIVLASMISYVISQNLDVKIFMILKNKYPKYLWLRNNAGTMISQFVDTIVFISIAFYGTIPNSFFFSLIMGQYAVKWIIAVFDTPFLYVVKFIYKK
ncbi:MAG: queuosine precursor transporter [Candidatus Methanofastidiosa archaeon]|nr:queuosine precursor transporter [Candidatus Methanofastidiosa archaeon]